MSLWWGSDVDDSKSDRLQVKLDDTSWWSFVKKRTLFSELLRFLPCKNVRTEDSWMCVVVSRCKEPLSEEGGTLSVKDEGLRWESRSVQQSEAWWRWPAAGARRGVLSSNLYTPLSLTILYNLLKYNAKLEMTFLKCKQQKKVSPSSTQLILFLSLTLPRDLEVHLCKTKIIKWFKS